MFTRSLFPALLTLGIAFLVSVPHDAQAQQKPVLTTLHFFNDTLGANPGDILTRSTDGTFYGTTCRGTSETGGIIYKMTPGGRFTPLYVFSSAAGYHPVGALVQGKDGAFYGTTECDSQDRDGKSGDGTAYKITLEGRFTALHTFHGLDGSCPLSALLLAPDGSFYGTTAQGGAENDGTVFRMTPDGTVTTLHSFTGSDGKQPHAAAVFGPDGALYGTTDSGGSADNGTVYRLTTDGTFSLLHSFTGSDGSYPCPGLTLGRDGTFYGLTEDGGAVSARIPLGAGTAYKITPSGVFTLLHTFPVGGQGRNPSSALTLGANGKFYGTTEYGGTPTRAAPQGAGTVFCMTSHGQITPLYRFHTAFDGAHPSSKVTFGLKGALYGTTLEGGAKSFGTIFKLTLP